MNNDKFQTWLDKLGRAWTNRDVDKVMDLFAKNVEYFENALEKPVAEKSEVHKLWKLVPENQKDVKFSSRVLMSKSNSAIANWQVTRTRLPSQEREEIDGVFLFDLDDDNKCTLFKQWRTSKIIKPLTNC